MANTLSSNTQYKTWFKQDNEDLVMNENHLPFWQAMLDKVTEKDLQNKTILDFGCGCGGFLRYLYQSKPFQQAVGIDLAEQSIKKAIMSLPSSQWPVKYQLCDQFIKEQSTAQQKFDLAFSYEVIYLVPDLNEHARFIKSILSPAGVYYAATGCHTQLNLWPQWKTLIEDSSNLPVPDYSPEDFASAFRQNGFFVQATRLNYQGFVQIGKYPDYFPSIEQTIDYYAKDMILFRFAKSEDKT